MNPIAILTDTDASLPAAVAARHDIRQVPIVVQFGKESLMSGTEIDDAQLFARVDREGMLPTTSAPSPGQFLTAYQQAFDDGAESIVCFCVSSEVSATYGAACTAAATVSDREITVIDTRSLSMGQGYMALLAAEARDAGAGKDEIVARALAIRDRTYLYAALATLKYLAMSGRVGGLAAGVANLLNIKPILTIQDGKLDLLEKVRSQRRAWARAIELAGQSLNGRPIERLAILHVAVPNDAQRFQQQVVQALPYDGEVIFAELGPGLSVHAGSGVVGLVAVAQD
jgi:DegV family protein with EDD domain